MTDKTNNGGAFQEYPINPLAQAQAKYRDETNAYGAQPQVTAQTIRKDGQAAADDLKALAKKVEEEAASLVGFCHEVADYVTETCNDAADQVNGLLVQFGNTRAIVQGEKDKLRSAPKTDTQINPEAVNDQNHSVDAVEKALGLLRGQPS